MRLISSQSHTSVENKEILSHTFRQNSVKATVLLKKWLAYHFHDFSFVRVNLAFFYTVKSTHSMEISPNHSHVLIFHQTIFKKISLNLLRKMRLFFTMNEFSLITNFMKNVDYEPLSNFFRKILSYVPWSMLEIVSKLVKFTPFVLLRSWVVIMFDNWFWCTNSCTNWFTLAIFRHIQVKNHNLQFRKMCFIATSL